MPSPQHPRPKIGQGYPPWFKDQVLDQLNRNPNLTRVARETGISREMLRLWAKAAGVDRSRARGGPKHPGKNEFHRQRLQGVSIAEAAVAAGAAESSARKWDREYNTRPKRSKTVMRVAADHAPEEKVCDRFLSLPEREKILDLRNHGCSAAQIARELGRARSTITRELARNSGRDHRYLPYGAHRAASERRARPKASKLVAETQLRRWVQQKLLLRWSPAQISKRLVEDFPQDQEMRVSHETLYQALYFQARGGLKKEVQAALRTGRARRKPQGQQRRPRVLGDEMIMISERPAQIEDRAVPGHWEGDLIMGASNRSAIATLVERRTRFTMLCHLPQGHNAAAVADALTERMKSLPGHLRGSLTWDQGSEMAAHQQVSVAADLAIYFCDPASPWQRGTNENTNGLLRQFFPKGSDLSAHGPEDLEHVAGLLNGRPRMTLQWRTPAEAMRDLLTTS
ncbi:IS30 family transposase [Nesterenkonia lutea]|uniref:IS30 family transposase n=1 Tax=Nesterenkonia lutea TaxID=272919 RepID=A0ABR9JBE4_9MICC|nr:IS30 family transposase [Nesterenkonia lutea]